MTRSRPTGSEAVAAARETSQSFDGPVVTPRGEGVAVGAEGQGADPADLPREGDGAPAD